MTSDNERRLTRAEAAALLTGRGYRTAKATLDKLAVVGGGPSFEKFGRRPLSIPRRRLWPGCKAAPADHGPTRQPLPKNGKPRSRYCRPRRGKSHRPIPLQDQTTMPNVTSHAHRRNDPIGLPILDAIERARIRALPRPAGKLARRFGLPASTALAVAIAAGFQCDDR